MYPKHSKVAKCKIYPVLNEALRRVD